MILVLQLAAYIVLNFPLPTASAADLTLLCYPAIYTTCIYSYIYIIIMYMCIVCIYMYIIVAVLLTLLSHIQTAI